MELPDMRLRFFGEPWGATIEQAPTPVGEPCIWNRCDRLIEDGDVGYLMPSYPVSGPHLVAWHRECFRECLEMPSRASGRARGQER